MLGVRPREDALSGGGSDAPWLKPSAVYAGGGSRKGFEEGELSARACVFFSEFLPLPLTALRTDCKLPESEKGRLSLLDSLLFDMPSFDLDILYSYFSVLFHVEYFW